MKITKYVVLYIVTPVVVIALGSIFFVEKGTFIEFEVSFLLSALYFFTTLILISTVIDVLIIVISKIREKKRIRLEKYSHDMMIASIKVINDGNERIEECWAKINKVNVIGNNEICRRIIDENINDKRICWDEGIPNVDIEKGHDDILNVAWAKGESLELLFYNHQLSLPLYPDRRKGENAYKAKYQLEIELNGIIEKDSKNIFPAKISYWEIYYRCNGMGTLPSLVMQKIKFMKKSNNIGGDLHGSCRKEFEIVVNK